MLIEPRISSRLWVIWEFLQDDKDAFLQELKTSQSVKKLYPGGVLSLDDKDDVECFKHPVGDGKQIVVADEKTVGGYEVEAAVAVGAFGPPLL